MTLQLRRLASDGELVARRLDVLERWAASGEMAPWMIVLVAEWVRSERGRTGAAPTIQELQSMLLDEDLVQQMREQVDDGPWAVYTDQANGVRANDSVMSCLVELETALAGVSGSS